VVLRGTWRQGVRDCELLMGVVWTKVNAVGAKKAQM
jgi:hypothetical protein